MNNFNPAPRGLSTTFHPILIKGTCMAILACMCMYICVYVCMYACICVHVCSVYMCMCIKNKVKV